MKKKCTKCGRNLKVEEFGWRNKAKERRQSWCRQCQRDASQFHYYHGNRKSQVTKRKKMVRDRLHKLVNRYKTMCGCRVCGYRRCAVALDFHHSDKKEGEVSRMICDQRPEAKIKEEIRKCIVLCSNCHRELHDAEGEEVEPPAFQVGD